MRQLSRRYLLKRAQAFASFALLEWNTVRKSKAEHPG